MVTSLIQMFTNWQHFHLGTEPKTVVSSLIQLFKKMAISTNGYRAKDCCAITDIQLLRKRQHRHFDTETKTKHCHITDTVVKKLSTSTFGNKAQDVLEHVKCRQKTAKI